MKIKIINNNNFTLLYKCNKCKEVFNSKYLRCPGCGVAWINIVEGSK